MMNFYVKNHITYLKYKQLCLNMMQTTPTINMVFKIPYDTPIKTYKILQTIGKAIDGGDKNGLSKELQSIDEEIANPTIPPIITGIAIDLI